MVLLDRLRWVLLHEQHTTLPMEILACDDPSALVEAPGLLRQMTDGAPGGYGNCGGLADTQQIKLRQRRELHPADPCCLRVQRWIFLQ